MNDSQILSTFADLPRLGVAASVPGQAPSARPLVWDACQLGVVLRAVLFVQAVTAVGVMFVAPTLQGWLMQTALLTAGTLPATLLWLLLACGGRRIFSRWPMPAQWVTAAALGAAAGLAGCALLAWSGVLAGVPWTGSATGGALMALVLLAGLVWRAKAMMPASTQARLVELQSRIRPHFLFNTLNSAIALVRAEPQRAEALLEDLSELFRHALTDQGQAVPLAQEIDLARRYLAIEQVRFGERLRVSWAIDPDADAARLPPLILQPLVENAVKHGVEPSADGATLHISTQRRGDVVVIKVTNTVPAGSGPAGHGLALANVRERLALLHDVEGQFRHSLRDGVFQVRLELPA
jgi:two-component system, LytTR family, sensor histidine kinase AlgZ